MSRDSSSTPHEALTPAQSSTTLPTPSTSKLNPSDSTSLTPKPEPPSTTDLPRSTSPDTKGKARASELDEIEAEVEVETKHIGSEEDGLDEREEILLAKLQVNIVGIANYKGIQTCKEGKRLELRRDHVNVSDKNAIEVRHDNKGVKIGMLAKSMAAKLAPLMDEGLLEFEAESGEIPLNTVGVTAVPMTLHLYGIRSAGRDRRLDFAFPARAKKAAMIARMKAEAKELKNRKKEEEEESSMVVDDAAGKPVMEIGEDGLLKFDSLMQQSILVEKTDRPTGDILGDLFKEGAADPLLLPTHPCPPGKKDKSMRTDLMEFQKQGLAWMIRMEHPELPKSIDDPPTQLWVKKLDIEGNFFWYNVATGSSQRDRPVLKRGGILADEMGLGKTMQTIALICTDDTGTGVLDIPEEPDERFDDMTLIVCPLSVASNWTVQFHHHVGSKRLKWHLYHGEGRNLTKKQLRQFDVVIATYQTVAAELPDPRRDSEPDPKKAKLAKNSDILHQIKWRRIVLDEGHVIKNPNAKMSKACATLKAERRWILTGTPIINATTDLGAMITFLRLCRPLDDRSQWMMYVGDGKTVTEDSAKLLRAVVSSTTLRRTKDMKSASGEPLVKLPELKFYVYKVALNPETRQLYDEIATQLKAIVEGFMKSGTAGKQYSHVLVFLLRLRQLACDPTLCPQSFIDDVRARNMAHNVAQDLEHGPRLDKHEIARLQGVLRETINSNADCTICGDVPIDPRITVCEHVFCSSCIDDYVDSRACCAVCRYSIGPEEIIEAEPVSESASVVDEGEMEVLARQAKDGASYSAAKTARLIELLKATEPGVKSLVFSQWTSHLNCIEAAFESAGVVSCKFDGSMSQQKREDLIKTFSTPTPKNLKLKKGQKGPPTVMLISLKAGALGLNLVCASQVFLMDPWWQASIEQQAIDRVYRIGQTKPVRVFQLVADDTVESRVLEIQEKKEQLIRHAFSGNKNAPKTKEKIESRLNDIAHIFGL